MITFSLYFICAESIVRLIACCVCICIILLAGSLAACGTKGPLYIPEQQYPQNTKP